MTQGNIAKWYVKEGDEIAPGTVLADIETDKATLAFENQEDGFIAKILLPDGSKDVPVGKAVAIIVEDAESVGAFANYSAEGSAASSGPATSSSAPASSAQEPAAPASAAPTGDFPAYEPLNMPALSPTMEQGNIVQWHVKEGDELKPGDVLADIETDKATLAFENQEEGYLAKILYPAGSKDIAVGTMVAVMVDSADLVPAFASFSPGGGTSGQPASAAADSPSGGQPAAAAAKPAVQVNSRLGPAARFALAEAGLAPEDVPPSGPNGIVTKADVMAAVAARVKHGGKPAAAAQAQPQAPAAAAAAKPAAAAPAPKSAAPAAPHAAAAPAAAAPAPAPGGRYEDIPNSQIRKIIAKRLLESKLTTPSLYVSADAELDGIMALRKTLAEGGAKVSVNDFVVRAAALALRDVPAANAAWDAGSQSAAPQASVDIAVAVATDAGLITPIVKGADKKGLRDISSEVKQLASRARANKLLPEEFQGGSFTISNLGMYGLSQFAAIINPPQGAIMAVGGAQQRVHLGPDGRPATRTLMTVTLSADQRVIEGDVAADFLTRFCHYMANPLTMLI